MLGISIILFLSQSKRYSLLNHNQVIVATQLKHSASKFQQRSKHRYKEITRGQDNNRNNDKPTYVA